ncbi:MAG TPA: diiron oxygenase [Acidimicrobiales bacterium]|jgi:hypothetical protein|nr:diiron oxygenase [Acidimicrobiales bacterium]
MAVTVEDRIERLTTASARRVIEPDVDVPGGVGDGQVLPDELLSIAGLPDVLAGLTPEQKRTLSREEVASIAVAGIRFEAVLEAGFAAEIATAHDVTDPRLTFILHEMGEETRHMRLFQRLVASCAPTATTPIPFRLVQLGYRLVIHASVRFPALFYVLVLGGEEIPDLFQKLASEHPDTDEFVRAVNKYHRLEEARHLSFARATYPDVWSRASWLDRFLVKHVAPHLVRFMFESMVHPGVYATVGLPAMPTWRAVNRSEHRRSWRHEATRPVLEALVDAGAFGARRVPRAWRALCGM